MNEEIQSYNEKLEWPFQEIADSLASIIDKQLTDAENKIWHAQPVWFLDGNPIVGYSKQKNGLKLMFWSGADFNEENLNILGGKFKDASIIYNAVDEINEDQLVKWLNKSREIQWDYKNIVKRKGKLERLH
ncbi:DUF1801 domain-containing protein [Christiangramia flava]|uniref:Leucyl-tRNA synthetase n=1 Tax=Christiangramia flava JLT2011 TaxID=1229726 RepID=A0A1L7I5N8_9FLAO|nr:DUF1801 domain-containing protein [Christiangramia flava]APU68929.1 leucyl-tRNA synthetase [Christiangramia flava JLT2011]OSS38597.1 leucyl-tRNA synthetase [Christiangramia flava JLT2011]